MRFYHPGDKADPKPRAPVVKHPVYGTAIARPLMFCPTDAHGNHIPQYDACHPNAIVIAFKGHTHWIVPPGGYVDLPNELPVELVKAHAPQLLTEEEAVERGLAVDQPRTVPVTDPAGANPVS
ncbi:MAG TPA: hypothetical protein VJ891_09630 [Casimicrobiaceae bacterium]|nr:hypothetical protein [Casimicrobiaceae bacterium]